MRAASILAILGCLTPTWAVVTSSVTAAAAPSPTIVLDYTTLVPAAGNTSLGFYVYRNIRYAAVPTGELRWAKPKWPPVETAINTGNLAATDVSCTAVEDCLYMDVWVPTNSSKAGPLPVMVWQYGGGFNGGSKNQESTFQTTPEGLYNLTSDFIFVAFNYRLGITALATGPTFSHNGGTSNVGLWDTEHGFRWIQKYIHAFGGDPAQVTATGHSAGTSQVLFQITRLGGQAEQLFSRAFVASPGYWPGAGHWLADQFWLNVSATAGCAGGSVDCMRNVSFRTLTRAAQNVTSVSGYVLQPKVDGDFVADTYDAQFYKKNFNFSGAFVITHNSHEENGTPFAGINSIQDIRNRLTTTFPAMTNQQIDEVFALYPEADYASPGLRFADIAQSFEMTSHSLAVTNGFNNNTWNGELVISPGTHILDQYYYWYSTYKLPVIAPPLLALPPPYPIDAQVAVLMQKYLLSFVITGNPNTMWKDDQNKIYWPKYNEKNYTMGTTMIFNSTRFSLAGDDLATQKNLFWNKQLWY